MVFTFFRCHDQLTLYTMKTSQNCNKHQYRKDQVLLFPLHSENRFFSSHNQVQVMQKLCLYNHEKQMGGHDISAFGASVYKILCVNPKSFRRNGSRFPIFRWLIWSWTDRFWSLDPWSRTFMIMIISSLIYLRYLSLTYCPYIVIWYNILYFGS